MHGRRTDAGRGREESIERVRESADTKDQAEIQMVRQILGNVKL